MSQSLQLKTILVYMLVFFNFFPSSVYQSTKAYYNFHFFHYTQANDAMIIEQYEPPIE